MSFILDALRKSEHDRQRGSGPGIAEVAVARKPERSNPWALLAIGLLLLNLLVFGGWLLLKALRDPPALANGDAGAEAATPPDAPTLSGGPSPAARGRETPPMLTPAREGPADTRDTRDTGDADGAANPLADELSASAEPDAVPLDPAGTTVRSKGGGRVVYESNPLDSAPTGSIGAAPATAPVATESASSGLPRAEDVTGQAGIPELHLDIHVYSTVASERFVFVNGGKYREGDTLQAGPTVETITADGVVLSYAGRRFVLARP